MVFLTDFADQAVLLPVATMVLLGLLATGWRRGALAWGVSVTGVLAAMLVLKMAVLACGARLGLGGAGMASLVSPSGHTAGAAVVYGGLLALLVPRSRTALAVVAGGAVALLFGATRLALHVHTVADVLAGAAVGVSGAVAMRWLAGTRPAAPRSPRLAVLALAMMALLHGRHLPAESRVRGWAVDVWPFSTCRAR